MENKLNNSWECKILFHFSMCCSWNSIENYYIPNKKNNHKSQQLEQASGKQVKKLLSVQNIEFYSIWEWVAIVIVLRIIAFSTKTITNFNSWTSEWRACWKVVECWECQLRKYWDLEQASGESIEIWSKEVEINLKNCWERQIYFHLRMCCYWNSIENL